MKPHPKYAVTPDPHEPAKAERRLATLTTLAITAGVVLVMGETAMALMGMVPDIAHVFDTLLGKKHHDGLVVIFGILMSKNYVLLQLAITVGVALNYITFVALNYITFLLRGVPGLIDLGIRTGLALLFIALTPLLPAAIDIFLSKF